MSEPNKKIPYLHVHVDGGMFRFIATNVPELENIDVIVTDGDVDGADRGDLLGLPCPGGGRDDKAGGYFTSTNLDDDVDEIARRVQEKQDSEDLEVIVVTEGAGHVASETMTLHAFITAQGWGIEIEEITALRRALAEGREHVMGGGAAPTVTIKRSTE